MRLSERNAPSASHDGALDERARSPSPGCPVSLLQQTSEEKRCVIRARCRRRAARRGATAVEFAFVAPVFFLFVFGLMEIGRMLMLQQAMTNAAREGCRAAGLASCINASQVETAVRDHLESSDGTIAWNTSKVRVTAPGRLANVPSQTDLTVAVEVDYADATWLPLGYLGVNPTIAAEARRKRE
jgi:Flp pilus assembly protein TadG